MSLPEGWSPLAQAGLVARALRVPRREVAYFKYLFESYEGLAIVRTVRTLAGSGGGDVIIAVLAPEAMAAEAEAILAAERCTGASCWEPQSLPPECREDWFLERWVR